jgi:hypothetical protein
MPAHHHSIGHRDRKMCQMATNQGQAKAHNRAEMLLVGHGQRQ